MLRLTSLKFNSFADGFNALAYFLLAILLFETTFRRVLVDSQDPYKCNALMHRGQWLDSPSPANGSRAPYKAWQAPGCLIHQYKPKEIASCTDNRKIFFAGDSTIRQVYWAMARKLNKTMVAELEATAHVQGKHIDQTHEINGVTLEFLWDPFLNSSRVEEELKKYQEVRAGRGSPESSAALMLMGTGTWWSRWYDAGHGMAGFQKVLEKIIGYTEPAEDLAALAAANHDVGDQVFLQPVQIPIYEKLNGQRVGTIKKDEIDMLNTLNKGISDTKQANMLWSYAAMTRRQEDALEPGGFHVIESVADAKADVILNLRCNAKIDKTGSYPYDRTCCSGYKPMVWTQWAALAGFIAIVATAAYSTLRGQETTNTALLMFVATLAYCFLADRTQLFDKDRKHFSNFEFWLLSALTLIAGVLSIRRSGKPNANGQTRDQPFLSRDQTEEWKGWMQFAILIYHWTGASTVLPIYEVIRLMVASYLFQTGFGHTCYFLKKGDFSFKRVAGVLVRLNLLSCALPYVMGTDYLFYYFAPLVTFWFGIVWLTMRVYSSKNDSTRFVLGKIVGAAILVTLILETPLFDWLFFALELLFRISWDVHEWKFRLGLDRYIVFVGMVVALFFERYNSAVAAGNVPSYIGRFRLVAVVASIFALPVVGMMYQSFASKQESNAIQPYLAAVPILAFVILRNATPTIRNFHSSIFAWLGTFSLETFTLQFHIWLAADTKGLLSLGLFRGDGSLTGDRWRDFVVLTPVFFWFSWRLATATATLTQWILSIPKEGAAGASSEGLLEAGSAEKASAGGLKDRLEGIKSTIWPNELRLRIVVLLVLMWALNVTWP